MAKVRFSMFSMWPHGSIYQSGIFIFSNRCHSLSSKLQRWSFNTCWTRASHHGQHFLRVLCQLPEEEATGQENGWFMKGIFCIQSSFEFEQFVQEVLIAMKSIYYSPKWAGDWFTSHCFPMQWSTLPKRFSPSISGRPNTFTSARYWKPWYVVGANETFIAELHNAFIDQRIRCISVVRAFLLVLGSCNKIF